ncbi:mechanosensitive ion channel domain-containing protein [Nannocystis pusilla]|uniref:mechanosensitive ion channel family protein n=1 Tax=Nannocystis pusilla TaxID=889268 RepID=UPI003DA40DCE
MDDAVFPLPQLQWLALEILPKAARGYADVAAELVFALLLGLLLRFVLFPLMVRASARNDWVIDDIITARLRDRALLWAVLAGVVAAVPDLPWKARSIAVADKIASAVLALSVTLTLMRIVSEIVGRNQSPAGGGTTLIKYIINGLLLLLGVGAILGLFGVSVFPALTALGVGGLAVALAFQDTLANVFAGVNLSASRQIRVGDFVNVDTKLEGFVTDIGWRTTTLRTLDDLLIYIPNKRLGEAIMTNFSRPDPTMWIEVPIRVGLERRPRGDRGDPGRRGPAGPRGPARAPRDAACRAHAGRRVGARGPRVRADPKLRRPQPPDHGDAEAPADPPAPRGPGDPAAAAGDPRTLRGRRHLCEVLGVPNVEPLIGGAVFTPTREDSRPPRRDPIRTRRQRALLIGDGVGAAIRCTAVADLICNTAGDGRTCFAIPSSHNGRTPLCT